MTAGSDELFVQIGGKDVGLEALLKKVDAEMQKSADQAVKLGQSYARLAQAQGSPTAASSILAGTLDHAGAASERSIIALETQAARLRTGGSAFQQFGQSAASGLASIAGPAALATTAIGGLVAVGQSFGDAFAFKVKLDATTASVKSQLEGFRDVGATYAQVAQFARQYNITQEETNSILQSSVGSLRTSTASVTQLETALLRLQSKDVSKPISEAARALAELESGDVTSIKELFRVSAKDALGMRDAIVAGGDSVQVLTAYLDRTQTGMDALRLRAEGVQGAFNALKVANEDLALAQAQFAQGPGLAILQERTALTSGATRLLTRDTAAMGQSLLNAANSGSVAFSVLDNIMGGLLTSMTAIQNQSTATAAASATSAQASAGTAQIAAGAFDEERSAIGALQVATQAGITAQQQHTTETQKNAEAAVLAAAQQQAQKAATDQLTATTAQAVSAFLALNPTLDAAGIAAVGAANNTNPLIIKLAQLRVEAYSTRDAVAALAAAQGLNVKSNIGPGGVGVGAPGITSGRNNDVDAVVALQKAQKDASAAERQYQGVLGNTGPALAHARSELAQLTKGSAAYIQKQIEIAQLEQKGAKGGGGGGGTRLTDQQKLNNQLLTDQDKANNQFADAEETHQDRLFRIQLDYAQKTLAQQKANEVSKRASMESFYDQLTSSELNKSKAGTDALRAIDAQYQADYKKAQELAQAGKAKQSADLLSLAQKQASDEIGYQENLAKAQEKKNKAEVSRLEAIHKLHQDTANEERKQVLEGGDANVDARSQALTDEQAQYEGQKDKIGTAAERAVDREAAAALRAGKAIDENILKAGTLADTYDRVGTSGSRAGITPAASSPAPATTPAPAAVPGATGEAAPTNTDAVVVAITGLRDLLSAIERATNTGADKVAGAVRQRFAS